MSREKLERSVLGAMAHSAALAGPLELPEGAVGMTVYGPGLPKEGVYVSREEMEAGVVAVAAGPPRSSSAVNGRSLI